MEEILQVEDVENGSSALAEMGVGMQFVFVLDTVAGGDGKQ